MLNYREYFKPFYQRPVDDLLVNKKNLIGVEIGIFQGHHAREMFEKLDIVKLYLVDPYRKYDSTLSPHLESAKEEAKRVLAEFKDKIVMIYKESVEAVKDIDDESLDFVYIDGGHSYDAVSQDIPAWYPKVKSGGLVGGHDYTPDYFPGVVKAVDEFCKEKGVVLNAKYGVQRKEGPATNRDWWFVK